MSAGRKEIKSKTKFQLIREVEELRQKVLELETKITEQRQSAETIESKKNFLQNILDTIPLYIFLKDRGHRLTYVNEALVKATGRPREEWIGKMVFELFSDRDIAQKYYQDDEDVMSCGGQSKFNIIETLPTPDGIQWLHTQKVPLKDETGHIVGLSASSINITQRMALEEALNKCEQEKTAILDSLVEHVVYHDLEMRVLWTNRAACESVQMKREDLIGSYCYEVWAGRRGPCEDCPVIKALETGQPQTVEKMTPDGRWWYIQGSLVQDSKGHVTGTIELTLDITGRKRAEEIIRKTKDELEARVEERTAELSEANVKLRQEITERNKAEKELKISEMLLSSTFNALQDLMVVIDKDFRVIMSNWKDHAYISEKDRRDHPYCYEVFMHRKSPCTPCHTMDVFATGQMKQLEVENPIDGKIRDIRVLPIFDDKGNVLSVIQHLRDITERKQIEKELTESEKKYRSVVENASQGIIITQDGLIRFMNPRLAEMSGYVEEEVLS
ncbi:MAG: PAS domain-containing protein, partial [Deltaproteobacteria bacterium]|nr:PAS domain-containing protein [Deltaproteobacteria bacterium]